MSVEFSRPVPVERIGGTPSETRVEAGPAERAALAVRLGLPSVAALACTFRLVRLGRGVIEAEGDLAARVEQVCVVSLEPFEAAVAEHFRARFVPAGSESDDDDPESVDEIPYEGAMIDLGEAAAEQLALALDPYPRKPGAHLPEAAGEADGGPFAALSALRRRR